MIILEGPDNVGKTTLAKKLLEQLPTHIYSHFSRLPWKFDYFWGYTQRISRFIVQDRFHMSELAYAQAHNDKPQLSYEDYRLIDARIRLVGGYTILLTADRSLIAERWTPDEMFSLDKTLEASRIYDVIACQQYEVHADFDYLFHATQEQPYVTDTAITAILADYRERQATVSRVLSRYLGSLLA